MAIQPTAALRGVKRSRVLVRFVGLTACAATAVGLSVAGPAAADNRPGGPARVGASVQPSGTGWPAQGATDYAQLSTAKTARGKGVRYAVPQRVCAAPTPARLTCMAVQLVPAAKGTKGAKAYVAASSAPGPAGGYTPADLATAYRYDRSAGGTSQTVAIIDAYDDPNALSDLNSFDRHYGLPAETATSFRKVNEDGAPTHLPSADRAWASEIALDIQTVRAVCAHCMILLVEADVPSTADLATAVNTAVRLKATEISNSYGGPESASAPDSVQAAYNHPGVVITASTGDHGWYDWDQANAGDGTSDNVPNAPAAYPSVVAVGGTALALTNGTRQHEEVWNENGPDDAKGLDPNLGWMGPQFASGGGCSTRFAAHTWQAQVANYARTGCGTRRLVGDIAADADPNTGFDVYDTYGSFGWVTTGGTSLSSPLIAAMWALAGGSGGVAYPAQSLYDNLRFRPASVFDVTRGGNSFCGGDSAANCSAVLNAEAGTGNPNNLLDGAGIPAGVLDCGFPFDGSAEPALVDNRQCNAASGYDGPSGVGTPNGLAVFRSPQPTVAIARPRTLKLRTQETFSAVSFTDPLGGHAASDSWHWGDGTVTNTSAPTASASHVYTRAGARTVTLFVKDNFGQQATATTKIVMGVPPTARIAGPTSLRRLYRGRFSAGHSTHSNTGGSIAVYSWHWGDHTTSRGAAAYHRYAHAGVYTVTLIVVDNAGLRGSRTLRVSVHS